MAVKTPNIALITNEPSIDQGNGIVLFTQPEVLDGSKLTINLTGEQLTEEFRDGQAWFRAGRELSLEKDFVRLVRLVNPAVKDA